MEAMFWSCLLGGAVFALLSVIVGDIVGSWLDGILDILNVDFLKPIILASAVTTFGGAGVLLVRYTSLSIAAVIVFSILIALLMSVIIYFAYVKPMENSENSTGFSAAELPGKLGEVTVPIPKAGFGEIMVNFVAGNTLHIASSWDNTEIPAGTLVVVIDSKDGVVQVSRLYENGQEREMV
ncbi:protease [Paenibacillus woosongensis]|uniref:Protease n=1 Tax=Paenibacillus woosongensis TaxID=307580 RepID=A0A7X3CN05_9BACL|nr:protease [Paenibacillus woosongensis]MUG45389.1 protease [Paenibacillus woosongensis]